MKIVITSTTQEVLAEISRRLQVLRLYRRWTQGELAARAGVSKSSIERMESGAGNCKMDIFIAVCRALGLADRLDLFLPEPTATPYDVFRNVKTPQRVRHAAKEKKKVLWGDEK